MAVDIGPIAVFGAGSIGCYVGGMLQSAGAEIRFFGRERSAKTVSDHGLELTRLDGSDVMIPTHEIIISADPAILSDCTVILLCVKSQDTAEAAVDIAAHKKAGAKIISLQNGVENAATLASSLGEENVLAGMVAFIVLSRGDGRFHRATEGDILLQDAEETRQLATLLNRTGTQTKTCPDMQDVLWGNLLLNLNNALNVLSDVPLVEQLSDRSYRKVLAAMIGEALDATSRAGIRPAAIGKVRPWLLPHILRLPNWLFLRLAKSMLAMDETARSSMWDDLQNGRAPEIDYLNGVVAKLASEVGTEAPANRKVIALVKQAFKDGHSPRADGAELLDVVESEID
ncbi:MAG: 2-dehydropantoate 2-reductase [Hyphomicrobiales bacterium]|nr:2-dehydropantoate 2-reductase [Hyphomicrobiales bacterium]MCP5000025.1 2-dehydropantoate 2-reductase [Hyphomicrobiales bacterium]